MKLDSLARTLISYLTSGKLLCFVVLYLQNCCHDNVVQADMLYKFAMVGFCIFWINISMNPFFFPLLAFCYVSFKKNGCFRIYVIHLDLQDIYMYACVCVCVYPIYLSVLKQPELKKHNLYRSTNIQINRSFPFPTRNNEREKTVE